MQTVDADVVVFLISNNCEGFAWVFSCQKRIILTLRVFSV